MALLAAIGEYALVALDAVGMLVSQDISLTRQRLVALPAAEVAAMPVLVHRLSVLATENQLKSGNPTLVGHWHFPDRIKIYTGTIKIPSSSESFPLERKTGYTEIGVPFVP